MLDSPERIREHYEAGIPDLDALLQRLDGLIPEATTTQDLARLDQFHAGGLEATLLLADKVGVRADFDILDAGSGLGGPARTLAERYGCRVIGIDLSPHFVALARALSRRAGVDQNVCFRRGDLLALPFEDAVFDLVWTQHAVMNAPDRARVYREFHRVLKPGGRLAFFDPILGDAALEVIYPTPWAADAATSTLLNEAQTRAALTHSGLAPVWLEDVTQTVLASLAAQRAQLAANPDQAHLGMVLGDGFGPTVMNFARNLLGGRLRLVMGCCEKPD